MRSIKFGIYRLNEQIIMVRHQIEFSDTIYKRDGHV